MQLWHRGSRFYLQREPLRGAHFIYIQRYLFAIRECGSVENSIHLDSMYCNVDLTSGKFTLTSKFIWVSLAHLHLHRPRMKTQFVGWKKTFKMHLHSWTFPWGNHLLTDFYLALPQSCTEHLAITSLKCFCASPAAMLISTECISELVVLCNEEKKHTTRVERWNRNIQQPTINQLDQYLLRTQHARARQS